MKENKFRRLAVVLAAVMSVGLASCGGSDSSSKTDTESQTTEDTSSVAAAADSSTAAEESTAADAESGLPVLQGGGRPGCRRTLYILRLEDCMILTRAFL